MGRVYAARIGTRISGLLTVPGVRKIVRGENANRLVAMRCAEMNINELLEDLNQTYHRQRQSSIDEELFDVVSGFEALTGS